MKPAEADPRPSDDIRKSIGQAGAVGKEAGLAGQAVALPDDRVDRPIGPVKRPFQAIGDPRPVLPPVIAGEAVEGEKIAVFEVDRARILVGDFHIVGRRRQHQLDSRGQPLGAAPELADEGPAQIRGQRADAAELPAVLAAIDIDQRSQRIRRCDRRPPGQRRSRSVPGPCGSGGAGPSARWRRRAACPGRRCAGWRGCWPAVRPCRRGSGRRAGGGHRSRAARTGIRSCLSVLRRPWNAQPSIET